MYKMDTKLEIQTDTEEEWYMCCSSIHKSEIVFFVQVAFLFALSIFSMIQIVKKADNLEIYFSLIASCLGIIVPSPSLTKNK